MNFHSFLASILILVVATLGSPTDAHSDPIIEFGGGAHSNVVDGSVNILLKVGGGWTNSAEPDHPGRIVEPGQWVWARFDSEIALQPSADGLGKIPYADVKFSPVGHAISLDTPEGRALIGQIDFFPSRIERNIQLDRTLAFQVSAVGVKAGFTHLHNEHIALFAQVAADLLGYQLVARLSNPATFSGFHALGARAEAGATFLLNDLINIRVGLGGESDLNLGSNSDVYGMAMQSDLRAFAFVRAELTKFVQLFVRAGIASFCNTGWGCTTSPEVLGGVMLYF